MASYFDEHDCSPLADNERPNDQLLMARLLIDSGIATALNMDFDALTGNLSTSNLPPATSKQWLEQTYPKYCFDEAQTPGYQCPICLKEFAKSAADDQEAEVKRSAVRLPDCGHSFHDSCLRVWLGHTSSCPMCRHELPTDDKNYEELKRQKKREKQREQDLADLHNSMFG